MINNTSFVVCGQIETSGLNFLPRGILQSCPCSHITGKAVSEHLLTEVSTKPTQPGSEGASGPGRLQHLETALCLLTLSLMHVVSVISDRELRQQAASVGLVPAF